MIFLMKVLEKYFEILTTFLNSWERTLLLKALSYWEFIGFSIVKIFINMNGLYFFHYDILWSLSAHVHFPNNSSTLSLHPSFLIYSANCRRFFGISCTFLFRFSNLELGSFIEVRLILCCFYAALTHYITWQFCHI